MIREHLHHIGDAVDERSVPIRLGIVLAALLSLPLLGATARTLGSSLDLGWMTLPLLAIAHVPLVIAAIAGWSIGCDVCR